jgi:hypothetical protein
MKTVHYQDYIETERKRMAKIRATIENSFLKRVARQRPVSPEKEALLTQMDKNRWKKYQQEGILRIYDRNHIDFDVFPRKKNAGEGTSKNLLRQTIAAV